MTLGELLIKLAEKSGTSATSEQFQSIVKATESIEVDETISNELSNLISVNHAKKSNKEIKDYFFAQFADANDNVLLDSFKQLGISDETYSQLKTAEPSTFKRISLLTAEAKKIQESIEKSKTGSNKEAELKDLYESKLKELENEKILAINQNKELLNQHQLEKLDWLTESVISKNPINSEIPFIGKIAKMAIQESLQKKGAKPVLVNGKIELRQLADENLIIEEDYESFVSKSLAENKLLKISETPKTQTQTQQTVTNNNGSSYAERLKANRESLNI